VSDSSPIIANGTWSRVSKAAIQDARLSPACFRVLAALGSYADAIGTCYPSVARIACDLGCTRSQVHRHLNTLCAFGYLVRWKQIRIGYEKNGRNLSGGYAPNGYQLLFPALPAAAAGAPDGQGKGDGYPTSGNDGLRVSGHGSANESDVASDATSDTERGSEPAPNAFTMSHLTTADVASDAPDDVASDATLTSPLTNPKEKSLKAPPDFFDSIVKEATSSKSQPWIDTAALHRKRLADEARQLDRRRDAQAAIWASLDNGDRVSLLILPGNDSTDILDRAEAAEIEREGSGVVVVLEALRGRIERAS
jgi:hypothetical protein